MQQRTKDYIIDNLMDIPRVLFSGFTGWLIMGVLLVWLACGCITSAVNKHEEEKRGERILKYGELAR